MQSTLRLPRATSRPLFTHRPISTTITRPIARGAVQTRAVDHTKYTSTKWWDPTVTAVVTGANRGIGFEIASELAKQGLTVIITARDAAKGDEARDKIEAAAEAEGVSAMVFSQVVDVTDPESIAAFASWVDDYLGGVNILINNAGIAYQGDVLGPEEAEATLKTNYFGTAMVCNGMLEVMRENSRIINISSRIGSSATAVPGEALRQKFFDVTSEAELDALCNKFVEDIKAGKHVEEGWSSNMYGVSKFAESMFTRLLAKVLEEGNVMVNACTPGMCQTDMTSGKGDKTALEGADTPVWLALLPKEEFVTGKFFGDRKEEPW